VLVRSDCTAAAEGYCGHGRAEPVDDAQGERGGNPRRARSATRSDGTGGPFFRRYDRHRGRCRSQGFGRRLRRGARARCRGRLPLASRFPAPPASAGIVWSGDYGRLSEEAFLRDFAGDLPADKARVLYAVQAPFKRTLLADKTTQAAWRSKPSWYAVSTEDRTINPDLQRFMAKRMGAKTIEVKASHLSLISQPETIASLILEAAGQK